MGGRDLPPLAGSAFRAIVVQGKRFTQGETMATHSQSDMFGPGQVTGSDLPAPLVRKDYHTDAMVRQLHKLRQAVVRARRRAPGGMADARATKDYLKLRDYMEKMSQQEWAAEVKMTRGRR